MYILTIYTVEPWFDIQWQQASENETELKQIAVDYFQEQFFEPDEGLSLEEQFEELRNLLDSGESDDPRFELRKADA